MKPDTISRACPHLGCSHDPDSHFAYPHAANYCYAQEHAEPIDLTFQSEVCLSGNWTACPHYNDTTRSQRVAYPSLVAAAQARRSRERKIALVIGGILLTLIGATAAALWYYWPFSGPALPAATPTVRMGLVAAPPTRPTKTAVTPPTDLPPVATQPPTVTPPTAVTTTLFLTITPLPPPLTATVPALPSAANTPFTTQAPTPTATVTETTIPTAQPVTSRWSVVHIVQPGDFVARIARRYGATVADVVQASQLDDPGLVYRGQLLTVPLSSAQKALAATPVLTGSRESGAGSLPLPAPAPSTPEAHTAPAGTVALAWRSEQPLEEGQYFALYLWWEEQRAPCFLTLLTEPTYTLNMASRATGAYRWAVQIVEGRRDGPLQILHRPLSPLSRQATFEWQTP